MAVSVMLKKLAKLCLNYDEEYSNIGLNYLNDRQIKRFVKKYIKHRRFYYHEKITYDHYGEVPIRFMSFYFYLYHMKGQTITHILSIYVKFTPIVRNKKMKQLLDKNNIKYHSYIIKHRTWDKPISIQEHIFDICTFLQISRKLNMNVLYYIAMNKFEEDELLKNITNRANWDKKAKWLII